MREGGKYNHVAMMTHTELEAILHGSPFVEQYGFQLESAGEGKCTLRCPCNPSFLRPDGIVSGPVLMAAADVAMWIAIISQLGRGAIPTVTT